MISDTNSDEFPLDSNNSPALSLCDLLDPEEIQNLQDQLARATGLSSIITDREGNPITRPSSFSRLCQMIRNTEQGEKACYQYDADLGYATEKNYAIRHCPYTGFWNGGTRIVVNGEPVAYWLIGQAGDSSFPLSKIREYARELGLDEEEAVTAYKEIPPMEEKQFLQITRLLHILSDQMASIAYRNYQNAISITKHEATNREITKNESFLKTLVATIPDLLWLKDPEGTYLYCNPPFEVMFASSREEIIGKNDYDFVPKGLADFFLKKDREAVQKGCPTRNEEQVTFAFDGNSHLLETIKTPVYDENNNLLGILGMGRDITELHETRLRLESIMNCATDGYALFDSKGRLLTVNRSGLKMYYGTDYSELDKYLGRKFEDLLVDFIDEPPFSRFREVMDSMEPIHLEGTRYFPKIDKWLKIQLYKTGNGFAMSGLDLTDLKQAEAQVLQMQKMDSVGRLAGGIAHDFNNMLDIIMGYADLAIAELGEQDESRGYVREIKRAAEKSTGLIRQLLTFARKQTVSPEIIDLNEIISSMLTMLGNLLEKSVQLFWYPRTPLWPIRVDPVQIDQILANLCVNSRDAMNASGKIIIKTENITIEEEFSATLPESEPGRYVVLTVEDNGSGMDEKTCSMIFEPFFTTKKVGQGTGLGLSTVYGIMKQNGGFIQITSKPDEGTTARLFFPEAQEDPSAQS